MNSNIIARGILKAVAFIFGIALLLYFLYLIQSVIVYIMIAVVLSLVGRPIVLFLRRRLKFNNTLAVITTMVFYLAILAGLVSLFIPLVAEQSRNLSLLNIDQLQSNIENL
ncbi:MAG: AI-2E family transporter, partial [Flavobacteriaceae bacterium]|nr:AI-2E family transporter [Flavobacteriaceae bacterium]